MNIMLKKCSLKSQRPEDIETYYSDLLANVSGPNFRKTNGSSSDTDDLFESLTSNRNINFSRSKCYFNNECDFSPRSSSKLKENGPLSDGYNSPHSPCNRNKHIRHTIQTPLKVLYKRDHDLQFMTTNQDIPKSCQKSLHINSIGSQDIDLNLSRLSSTPNNSSLILENGSFLPVELQTNNKTPINSKVGSSINTLSTSKNSSFRTCNDTPSRLSSFKRYSLSKVSALAKKEFEKIVNSAKAKKRLSLSSQNNSLCEKSPVMAKNTDFVLDTTVQDNTLDSPRLTSISNAADSKTPLGVEDKEKRILKPSLKLSKNITVNEFPKQYKGNAVLTPGANDKNKQQTFENKVTKKPNDVEVFIRPKCNSLADSDDDNDDMPCTQPASSIILSGVVAYVEIRCGGKEYRNTGTKAELLSLGAKVENNFTKKVTHCFFLGGKMSTYRRAVDWNIPIVSTLWIEACKAEMRLVPVKGYEPHDIDKYKEDLPLYKLKTKIRRPVTDSKVLLKPWRRDSGDKSKPDADVNAKPFFKKNSKADKIIDALHSVANDMSKSTQQLKKILTSPILQKNNTSDSSKEDVDANNKRLNKRLVFPSTSGAAPCEQTTQGNNTSDGSAGDNTNSSVGDARVSYDSDDLLVYAKKQAAISRCSAPSRLLTSRKCKKQLASYHKVKPLDETKNDAHQRKEAAPVNSAKKKTQQTSNKKTDKPENKIDNVKKPTTRKRKLIFLSEVVSTFEQDSGESPPDIVPKCPYGDDARKKLKTGTTSKIVKPVQVLPVVSDVDSDDSLTRAARRESSALFVKKEKKVFRQRNIPTIVCTSLRRSDVDIVMSIVSKLGKFTVESNVSEHTTHVVTCSPRRTINLLKGLCRGCWILKVQWVYESLEVGKWLLEDKFELTEFSSSVQQARVERQAFGPEFRLELFQGVGPVYVCRSTMPPTRDLTELIRLCSGVVVTSARDARIIIGSAGLLSPPLCRPPGRRQPLVVQERWVLDCITQLKELNPYDYCLDVAET